VGRVGGCDNRGEGWGVWGGVVGWRWGVVGGGGGWGGVGGESVNSRFALLHTRTLFTS